MRIDGLDMPEPPKESIDFLDPEAVKGKFMIVRLNVHAMKHDEMSRMRKHLEHMRNRLQCRELFIIPSTITMGMVDEVKLERVGIGFMEELEKLGAVDEERDKQRST